MSELEIQRRKEYKRNRKRWMIVQIVAIILFAAIAFGSFLVYNRMNRTYYVECIENSCIDYKVQYGQNNFFEEEWVGKDQAYISSLIRGINADFDYCLRADSHKLDFTYQYRIDAILVVADSETGAAYYTHEETLFPPKDAGKESSSSISVKESVFIDYVKYNQMARQFIDAYGLKWNAESTLTIRFSIDVLSSNKQFEKESRTQYYTALNVPMVVDSVNMYTTASSPADEVKVLEYQDVSDRRVFFGTAVSVISLDALLVLTLFVFLYMTSNEDITYSAKIRKLLRYYGAYIQRIDGEFEASGYQLVSLKSFVEMLGIRDTLQAPILMSENHDETMTRFLIPTNTKILYSFEIKVDNYDEIYGIADGENVVDVSIFEEVEPQVMTDVSDALVHVEYARETDVKVERTDGEPSKTKATATAKAKARAKVKVTATATVDDIFDEAAEAEIEAEAEAEAEAHAEA